MSLPVARTWAEHGEPEARVVQNARGEPWVAYVGTPDALRVLERVGGARYADARTLTLREGPEVRAWLMLPPTRETLLLLETVGRIVAVDERYLALRREALGRQDEFAEFYPPTREGLEEPYRHQVEAFSALVRGLKEGQSGFGCWLQQGMGKTRWATDVLRALAPKIALVVYQKITLFQWICCLDHVFPEALALPLVGPVTERAAALKRLARQPRDGTTVLLLNWEVLHKLQRELLALGDRLELVIADEVTKARNPASQMSKALRKVGRTATWRIGMTGTPMGGDPADLWAQFDFQDPSRFGMKYWDFRRRYCRLGGFTGNEFVEIREDRLPELVTRMYGGAYRATKATVTDMPPKTYQQVRLPMSAEQRRHYDSVAQRYGTALELVEDGREGTGRLDVASAIARTTRLMQISAGVLPLTEIEVAGEVFGGGVKRIPSAKTAWCVEYAREIVETTDSKGVLWTMFQAEADRLTEDLRATGVAAEIIDGRTPDARRQEILARYLDRGSNLRWLVVNVAAGAYGMDLPCADLMVYHSSTYDSYLRSQTEDRGHRLGRTRPYQIIDVMCENSVDELIHEAIVKKMNMVDFLITKGIRK